MAWILASNIVDRLREIRDTLGKEQQALAVRAGILPSQFSKWMTGKALPPLSRLETWAKREGWPVEIFTEGGRMPSELLKLLLVRMQASARPAGVAEDRAIYESRLQSGDAAVTGQGDTADSRPQECAVMIARDVGLAIARAIRQAHLERSRAGIERLADTLLTLAVLFGENGDDNTEILRAVQRLRGISPSD